MSLNENRVGANQGEKAYKVFDQTEYYKHWRPSGIHGDHVFRNLTNAQRAELPEKIVFAVNKAQCVRFNKLGKDGNTYQYVGVVTGLDLKRPIIEYAAHDGMAGCFVVSQEEFMEDYQVTDLYPELSKYVIDNRLLRIEDIKSE
jgi:hypothetical protein